MPRTMRGLGSGLLGVLIFSASLPATRIAVGGFSPLFLTAARAVIAALLGAGLLLALGEKRPGRGDLAALALVALGVVVGFPLLTALALQHVTAAHSVVFVGLLPLATAGFGVLRGGERPRAAFWPFAVLGSAAVAGFALAGGGAASSGTARGPGTSAPRPSMGRPSASITRPFQLGSGRRVGSPRR